jgi:hypothetical protein
MRMAIALGLHRDLDPSLQVFDSATLDLRRQIFWVVSYGSQYGFGLCTESYGPPML